MIKKTMLCVVLWLFVFMPNFYGAENFGGGINAQTLKNLPPGMVEKLSAGEIERLKQTVPSQKKEAGMPVNGLAANGAKAVEKEQEVKKPGLSIIEQQYRKSYASTISSKLVQFGYDIFSSATVKTSSLAVPGADYVLGTGDELRIRVWGSGMDADYSTVIDKEGRINVPRIGVIHLAGVKFGEVESIIKKEAQKYIQGINLSVVLTSLRSLEVYVVGAVENPGLHIVPSFSTIFDGLLTAGGVKKTGTLRHIKLFRNDKVTQVFDMYDLLLNGDRNSDAMLQNRDVIFVPGIGHTAAVAGLLNNEGIFEIQARTSVKNLVDMAGGMLPQAMDSRIDLRRFDKNKDFLVYDLNSKSVDQWNQIPVQNGDLVEFGFSQSMVHNIVKISGHVWDPDVFQFKPGMKLSDVLTTPDILKPNALTQFALIERYDKLTTRTTPVRFPLARVFSGEYDALLNAFDTIVILSRSDIGIREKIDLSGAVWNPGEYEYKPGLKLKDALALAGGLKFGARTEKVEIARQFIKDNRIQTDYIVLDMDKEGDFLLHPYDSILFPMIKDATFARKVMITGEVAYPGTYTIREGEKVSDLIQRAGGFCEQAYFYGAKYTSEAARAIQQQSVRKMIEQLQLSLIKTTSGEAQAAVSEEDVKAAEASGKQIQAFISKLESIKAEGRISIHLADLTSFKDSMYDFTLKAGDALHIPEKPSFVSVVGSVYSPGSFLYQPNQPLKFYLAKSGGVSKTADEDHLYLIKANGEILSVSQSNGFFSSFEKTILMPGDTIVAPEDLERVPYLKLIKDISDIVFKIATTAGIAFAI